MVLNKKCLNGLHPLKVISIKASSYDVDQVIRWCPECGAIVIDADCDGRTFPGKVMEMKLPKLAIKSRAEQS